MFAEGGFRADDRFRRLSFAENASSEIIINCLFNTIKGAVMSVEQENTRQIVPEIAGVTDATRVGDLTVRQLAELIIRVYEQPPVRRVPPGQQAVDEALAEIRRLLGSLDEAFQRVQAAILSELPARAPDLVAVEPVISSPEPLRRPVVRQP